ncbi:Glucan endo-1,3-beta-glucosidase A1 [Colletotrichum sp. SAR11_240]|nr:Glucan endo-1,3-beta-glucosidase A1 [Colletotrichum sp. SAR11_240]
MDTLPLEIITTISEHLEPSDFTAFESVNRALRHSIEQILADATVYTDEDEYASLEARLTIMTYHARMKKIWRLPKTDRAMRTFDLTAAILLALRVAQAQVPDIAGFSKTWFDDFTGSRGALPSGGNWIIDSGTSYPGGPANWGTGEIQTYTNSPSNIATNGQGNLVITAIKDAKGAWTSARIETKQTFMAPAGKKMRVQASLKLPNLGGGGIGYWPAFWTLGAAYRGNYWNWPSVGEIDIMENVNNVNRVWAVLHCGTNPGGPCNEPSGLGNNKNCPANSPCSGVFRTYTVEVDRTKSPEAIRWPTPSRGLEAPIMNAFTNLEKRTFLHNRPEKDVYKILIDCYRLRMEDDAKIVGIMEPDSIYASRSSDGKAGFRRFLETARRSVNGKLLPPWWNDEKQQECEVMAADVSGWSSLKTKLSKADVIQHYGDDHFPMQLRMLGEFVWGSAPGGQDGTQMRHMLASRETSTAGPGFVDVLHIDSTTGAGYSSAFN